MIWVVIALAVGLAGLAVWSWLAFAKFDKFYATALALTEKDLKAQIGAEKLALTKLIAHSLAAERDDIAKVLGEYRSHGHEVGSHTPPEART